MIYNGVILPAVVVLQLLSSFSTSIVVGQSSSTSMSSYMRTPVNYGNDMKYPNPMVTSINYTHENTELIGYHSMPMPIDGNSSSNSTGPYPVVIIIPDWDGVNMYEQIRATMFTMEYNNYIGFAADIYGATLQNVSEMNERRTLATLYRSNTTLFVGRIESAINIVKSGLIPNVDTSNIALVGYCLGGTGVLLYSLYAQDDDDIKAIVSIHGGLTPSILNESQTSPLESIFSKVLVISGGDDDASGDIITLENTMNNVSAYWEITRFSNIQHGWTVFNGSNYNEYADERTWTSSLQFIQEAFTEIEYTSLKPDTAVAYTLPNDNTTYTNNQIQIDDVLYTDTIGNQYVGYVAIPHADEYVYPSPGILVLPDWDGVNEYEILRAQLLAQSGYIVMAADIYGKELQNVTNITTRIELVTKYTTNTTLYVEHIERSIQAFVDAYGSSGSNSTGNTSTALLDINNIAIIGYCFGGTGVVQYLLNTGGISTTTNQSIKIGVAYHGGLQNLPNTTLKNMTNTFVLIESGGDDPVHGNQTILEQALNNVNASWEISRYSNVVHGFTVWDNEDAYSPVADIRSWTAMMNIFSKLLVLPVQQYNGTITLETNYTDTTPISSGSTSPTSTNNDPPASTPNTNTTTQPTSNGVRFFISVPYGIFFQTTNAMMIYQLISTITFICIFWY